VLYITELMINEQVRDKEVRLIDENGAQLGIVSSREAQKLADERKLDLVKIAPAAKPPVCRIMDYGKYRFDMLKREKEAKKKQKTYEYKTKVETLNRKFLKKINDMPACTAKDKYKKRYKRERDIEKIKYLQTDDLNALIDFINNYENNHPFPDYNE